MTFCRSSLLSPLGGLLLCAGTWVPVADSVAEEAKSSPRPLAEKVAMCTPCHGADGNGAAPTFPKIAGQHENYLAIALQHYRNGRRDNAVMSGIAKQLSDDDIEALAAHFASLPGKLTTLPRY